MLKDLKIKQSRIRFSGIYFSYKYKFYWPMFDFIALYNNMIVYFAVTLLNIYWWFNLINLLQLITLIGFVIRVGRGIHKIQSD